MTAGKLPQSKRHYYDKKYRQDIVSVDYGLQHYDIIDLSAEFTAETIVQHCQGGTKWT